MKHIFLSYHRSDASFAAVLRGRIEAAGYGTWIDTSRLRAGDDWRVEIDQGIKDALAVIVVMTPKAKASEYVTYEWSFAIGAGIRVIPILRKRVEFHPRLGVIQFLDFTREVSYPWDQLLEVLREGRDGGSNSSIRVPRDAPNYIWRLVDALNGSGSQDRISAIKTLSQADYPRARQILVDALRHPLWDVKASAAHEVGRWKNDPTELAVRAEMIDNLIEAVHDIHEEVRREAILAIGRLRAAEAIPHLIASLGGDDGISCHAIEAGWALSRIGPPSSPHLETHLHRKNRDAQFVMILISIMESIGRKNYVVNVSGVRDPDVDVSFVNYKLIDDDFQSKGFLYYRVSLTAILGNL